MSRKENHPRAELFQVLSHPVRLQILEMLAGGPVCVCDLVEKTRKRQPYISQQLAVLREADLVSTKREGWNIFYSLNTVQINKMRSILENLHTITQRWQIIEHGEKSMSKQNNNQQWHGIQREEIDWQPTVITDRCVGCGLCVTSCGRGVYAFDYEKNRPVVFNPTMCMVGCTTCATICTQDAIEFPSQGYIRQVIKENRLLRKAKDKLRSNPEEYDVQERSAVAS